MSDGEEAHEEPIWPQWPHGNTAKHRQAVRKGWEYRRASDDGKVCKDCGDWKPASEYYPVRTKSGTYLMSRCKSCAKARNRAYWHTETGAQILKRQNTRHYAEHREEIKARMARTRARNKREHPREQS